jgi:MATE family multidrug resistance protein
MAQLLKKFLRFFLSEKSTSELTQFIKLGLPMFFSQAALSLIGINAVIQSGNYSKDVLAGILTANAIWFPIFLSLGGLIFFVTPMVAQLYGARKVSEIGPLVRQAYWLMIPIILIGMTALFIVPNFLSIMDIEDEIIFHAKEYLATFTFAIPAILLMQPLRSLSEGIKRPIPITLTNTLILVLAILGNYAFIYGNWGFPEMGARGSGLSAIIGTWTSLIVLTLYIKFRKEIYAPTEFFKRFELPSLKVIKEILRGGLPMGISNFIELSMFSGATLILGRLGADVVAAHGIAINIGGFLFMVPLSIGMAASVIVGNKIGEKNLVGARYSSFYSLKFGCALGLINSIILLTFSDVLISFFTQDPNVMQLGVVLLMFAAFFQIADALVIGAQGSLRGYKVTLMPMFIMLISFWMFALPFGYSLAVTDFWNVQLGAPGMWTGMGIGLFVCAALMVWRMNYVTSKSLELEKKNLSFNEMRLDGFKLKL